MSSYRTGGSGSRSDAPDIPLGYGDRRRKPEVPNGWVLATVTLYIHMMKTQSSGLDWDRVVAAPRADLRYCGSLSVRASTAAGLTKIGSANWRAYSTGVTPRNWRICSFAGFPCRGVADAASLEGAGSRLRQAGRTLAWRPFGRGSRRCGRAATAHRILRRRRALARWGLRHGPAESAIVSRQACLPAPLRE